MVWNEQREELVLLDPASHGFAVYDLEGRRLREIALDPALGLDFSVPMRLEHRGEGYELLSRTRIVELDAALAARASVEPFAPLVAQGFSDGSLGDGILLREVFYGYADAVDSRVVPPDDPKATGTWRRGFARLDPRRAKLDFLLELPLEAGGEYTAYYYYDRRPYVAELGGKVYALRFTKPWALDRVTGRELHRVLSAEASEEEPTALYAWNRRLYVLTSRTAATAEPAAAQPELQVQDEGLRATLLEARAVAAFGSRVWSLYEIDLRRGEIGRRLELPSAAERLRLVVGDELWLGIEESAAPNVGEKAIGTTLLQLPAHEIVEGEFSCLPAAPPIAPPPPVPQAIQPRG